MSTSTPSPSHSPQRGTAAFYDMDGTLIGANVVHAYAYYALNAQTVSGRIGRTASLLASLPIYAVADKVDRKFFNEMFYKNYEGFSEDRLVLIGEEVFERVLKPTIFPGVAEHLKRSKEQGHKQVIVTGGIEYITKPLAEYLGFDDYVANRLEIKDGYATGRLHKPFIAGANKALWVRRYAERNNIDLDRSFAYADSGSDLPLLSVVGNPCAVNPDRALRTTAKAYDWPILTLGK